MKTRPLVVLAAAATFLAGTAMADGHIALDGAFMRAAPPSTPVVGAYVLIGNTGDADDTLVAARTEVAGRVELHEMTMDGDVMRMRELEDGIPAPAGGTVVLRPGGLHLMLMDLREAVPPGETRDITLTFASGAEMSASFTVAALPEIEAGLEAAGAPAGGAMEAGGMDVDGGAGTDG